MVLMYYRNTWPPTVLRALVDCTAIPSSHQDVGQASIAHSFPSAHRILLGSLCWRSQSITDHQTPQMQLHSLCDNDLGVKYVHFISTFYLLYGFYSIPANPVTSSIFSLYTIECQNAQGHKTVTRIFFYQNARFLSLLLKNIKSAKNETYHYLFVV